MQPTNTPPPSLKRTWAITAAALMMPLATLAQAPADSLANDSTGQTLHEATVSATRLVFITKKDTVVYNMDALNATKGDMLQDVISRMPGLELIDGTLYFKGKKVTRLQVNGTDFARGDTQTALGVLPAYIVKSVKAYEGKTDQHRITGIDDGEKEQVVDVILKKEYMGTWSGNADLGYGTDERWRERMFANTFTDRMRVSVYGGFANTGQYQSASGNGNWGDNGGAGASSGDTKYYRPGVSFMWRNKKAENETGYFLIDGNAGWDYRGHNDFSRGGSETALDDGTKQFDLSDSRTKDDEKIWSGRLYLSCRPWKNMYMELNPEFAHQNQSNHSFSRRGIWNGVDVGGIYPSALDSLVAHRNDAWPDGKAVNLNLNESVSMKHYNFYRHYFYATQQLSERNLRLSLRQSFYGQVTGQHENSLSNYTTYHAAEGAVDPLYNVFSTNRSKMLFSQSFADLYVPMKWLETMRFTYGHEYTVNNSDSKGYRLEQLGGIFADYEAYHQQLGLLPTQSDWQQLARYAEVTVNSNQRQTRHWGEWLVQYNKHGLLAMVRNQVKLRHDELDYLKGDYPDMHPRRNGTEYQLITKLRYTTDSIGTFEVSYSYERSKHDITNYITLPDRSNPMSISRGNDQLKDKRTHMYTAKYDRTFAHNRMFSAWLSGFITINGTTNASTYDKATGITTNQPVNISGNWYVSPNVYFVTPLDEKRRTSLNLRGMYTLNHTPDLATSTEGAPKRRSTDAHRAYVSASYNANWPKFSLSLDVSTDYTRLHSTDAVINGTDQWLNEYSVFFKAVLPWDMELKNNFNVWHKVGFSTRDFKPTQCVWNVLLSKSLLHDKSLSVQVECSDILNQRVQFWANKSSSGSSWGRSNVVKRFFMLHLVYNFSTKKKA